MNHGWLKYLPKFLYDYLDGRHVFQKAIGNTGWLMADRVLRMIIGLVVIVWVARYLGPENFGLLNYSIAFASLFLAFATLGLDNIVIREIVNNPESTEEIIGSAFFFKAGRRFICLLAGKYSCFFYETK